MTSSANSVVLQSLALGLVYDRTALEPQPLASAFMVANGKAATIASAVCFYNNNPSALKVIFPRSGLEMGVKSIDFHPKFDRRLAVNTVERGTIIIAPETALAKFNCCLLHLDNELEFLNETMIEEVSQALRFPLNLSEDGFRGSLKDIELPLVVQTLNNARKQGILYICDEMMRPVAQIFCGEGKVISAKYHNLTNELAIYQIVQKQLSGKFAFYPCKRPVWLPPTTIAGNSDMVLIEAHRRLDELNQIRSQMVPGQTYFARAEKFCNTQLIQEDLRKNAERLWQALDATTPAELLWLLVGIDDYSVYRTLKEMYLQRQIVRIQEGGTRELETGSLAHQPHRSGDIAPLHLKPNIALEPHDQIVSVSIDAITHRTSVKSGSLLGAIDAFDSWHLLHDISLLPYCSGSPIFKDDMVIGMHSGAVTSSVLVLNSPVMLQQMLWIDAVVEMLKGGTKTAPATKPELDGDVLPPSKPDQLRQVGCREVASFRCPNCAHKTFNTARSCINCGFIFVPNLSKQVGSLRLDKILPFAAAFVFLLAVSGAYALTMIPPTLPWNGKVLLLPAQPDKPWITASILSWKGAGETEKEQWSDQTRNAHLSSQAPLVYQIKTGVPVYLYILYKSSGNAPAVLQYPGSHSSNYFRAGESRKVGDGNTPVSVTAIPGKGYKLDGVFTVGGAPGTDQCVMIASTAFDQLGWLAPGTSSQSADAIFHRAQECLSLAGNPDGLLVHERDLSGAAGASTNNLYITSVTVEHR